MAQVHRFILTHAASAGEDVFVAGVGMFTHGVLDIPVANTATITAVQAAVAAMRGVDAGVVDTAVSPGPAPVTGNPFPQYMQPADVAAAAADPSSPLGTALKAAYDARGFPTSLAAGTSLAYRFRPDRSAYNVTAANLTRTRAAAAAAFAGTGRLSICCLGTSLTGGAGAGVKSASWPAQLQKMLIAKGYPDGGSGFIAGQSNIAPATDSRVTLGSGWSAWSAAKTTLIQGITPSGTVTFADTKPSTELVIYYIDYFTNAWTYSVDGGAAVTVTNTNTALLKSVTVSGLTSGNHTVVITAGSGAAVGTPTFVMGINFRNAAGVVVHNTGIGGLVTVDAFTSNPYSPLTLAKALASSLTLVELGANDSTPLPASYQTWVQTIITGVAAAPSDVALLAEPPSGTTSRPNGPGKQVFPAVYALADSNNVPVIDMCDRLVSWTSLDALGLGYDPDGFQVHLSAAGYAEVARTITAAIGV